MHAYKHLVMISDDGFFSKRKSIDHVALPTRHAAGRGERQAQKSPHRPPSHRTSTKPSGKGGDRRKRQAEQQLWRSYISKSKCTKHFSFGALLEVAMWKKVHAVVARSTLRSQNVQKTEGYGALLDVQILFCVAGERDYAPCQK